MCGRFVRYTDDDDLVRLLHASYAPEESLPPSWNIAPTQQVRGVIDRPEAGRELRNFRWGLIPPWAKNPDGGARMINARAETLLEKPAFRAAAVRRRLAIPMNGYYEWQPAGPVSRGKTPYYLRDPDAEVLLAAGLYEFWRDPRGGPDAPWLPSATIITRPAPDALGHIHDRSPLLLPAELLDEWLAPDLNTEAAIASFIAAVPAPTLTPLRVGTAVGNVRHNGPGLIVPDLIAPAPEASP
ncbi:MAG: SOS response-associated peptidase [Promicromonosporaceae bacterium]|nr:SOS response-associated peptidase [Promicromonosporaceae bacterium]